MLKLRAVLLIPVFMASSLFASFELVRSSSPRGMALGNALVADPDPINGILYNPALIAFSKAIMWQGVFSLDYIGFDTANMNTINSTALIPFTYQFKSDAIFKGLVLGLAFNRFQLTDVNSSYDANDNINYFEQVMTVSLAKKFENLFSYGSVLSIGVNANIFNHGLDANDYTKNNTGYFANGLTAGGFGLDLGATYWLNKSIVIGGMIENLIPPNVAFNNTLAAQGDNVATAYHLGISWEIARIAFMRNVTLLAEYGSQNLESTGDPLKDALRKNPVDYHFGYEFWEFEKMLGVRLGYEWSTYNGSTGYSHLGVGLAFNKSFGAHEFQVDVGWQYPLMFGSDALSATPGTLEFALNYAWSLPASALEFDPKKREELKNLEDMKQKLQKEQNESGNNDKTSKDMNNEVKKSNAPAENPDAIMTKANEERNKEIMDLITGYTKQHDAILGKADKLKKDYEPKVDVANKNLDAAQKQLAAAKTPEDKQKAQDSVTSLTAAQQKIVTEYNDKMKPYYDQLLPVKKDTAKKKTEIEKTYNDLMAKYKGKLTKKFKEVPPSINPDDFAKDLSTGP